MADEDERATAPAEQEVVEPQDGPEPVDPASFFEDEEEEAASLAQAAPALEPEEDDGYETVELDIDEEDIERYLEDEDGNRIGFVVVEDGEEVEYLYAEDDEDDGYETVEVEFDEDDVEYYLEDEDGNLVGFVLIEDGKEVEYYYEEEDIIPAKDRGNQSSGNEYDLGITREGVADATNDLNALYRDGKAIADEFRDVFDDINSSFDFLNTGKKKGGRKRR